MKNKKGYTLTEILIVLSILGILTGIATVSYRGYILSVNKRNLKQAGIMFATAVNTCIQSMGSWQPRSDQPTLLPCKADNTAELKSKLSFNCPPDATCSTHTNSLSMPNPHDKYRYYCLDIKKEVSGKNLHIVTRVSYINPNNYEIWCGENPVSPFNIKNDRVCRRGAPNHMPLFLKRPSCPALSKSCPCNWK